jgi:succinoglycan biosynthesis protein ExoA
VTLDDAPVRPAPADADGKMASATTLQHGGGRTGNPGGADLVTVIVPARNEEAFIARCLDSILAQDEPNLQVVVVDGGSTDRTAEIVSAFADRDPRVELVSTGPSTIPRSLNAALAAARGRWLVRVDAHATIPPGYVRRAVEHLSSGRWGGVGGRKDGLGVTPAGRAIAAALGSRFGVGDSVYHYGTEPQEIDHVPYGTYPTELLRQVGGWDERLSTANEDYELDYRLRRRGHRLLFDPGLTISWLTRQSLRDLFVQYRRYGRGKAEVARIHPESLRPRHLAAPVLVAWLVGAAVLAAGRRPTWAVAAAAPYAAGLAVAGAAAGRTLEDRRARRLVPVAFAAMHVGWGLGFWEGLAGALRPGRPGTTDAPPA